MCHWVLVCTQAKIHQFEFMWLNSQLRLPPCPLNMQCSTVVDNLSVASTILEMLESTLVHEIFMKAKYGVSSELTKEAFLGVW